MMRCAAGCKLRVLPRRCVYRSLYMSRKRAAAQWSLCANCGVHAGARRRARDVHQALVDMLRVRPPLCHSGGQLPQEALPKPKVLRPT